MSGTLVSILEDYGIAGLSLVLSVGLLFLFFKLEKRVTRTEGKYEETTKMCNKRSGYFGDAFDRLDKIEKQDVKTEDRFDAVDAELLHINKSVESISMDVKTILNHFAAKGMG